jgi:hypothetical protein
MKLQKAQRQRAKIKMALQGPSGSGKTYSALQLAFGLCNKWQKIAVIDTENHSAELYSNLGSYQVINLYPPFEPEKYVEAIKICEKEGIEVIIVDSISHEWEYLLDYHASLPGNSFVAWSKVTPRHNDFVHAILQSQCHVICTMRTKQDYILVEKNSKLIPEKVGLKSVQRDGMDYELTLVFDLDMTNRAKASKDRTGLFLKKPEEVLSVKTGELIREWCSIETVTETYILERIKECNTVNELIDLFNAFPQQQQSMRYRFVKRKQEILHNAKQKSNSVTVNNHQNVTNK